MADYKFYAFFVASKVGKASISVTVDVYKAADDSLVVNNQAANEIAGGLYSYTYTSATADNYIAVFKTADATVDAQQIPALCLTEITDNLGAVTVTRAGYLDALSTGVPVASVAAGAITATAIATGAIDADAVATDAVTEIGTGVWASTTRTLTQAASTVASTYNAGEITCQRGDILSAAITGLGDLTGYTKLWFTVKRDTADSDTDSVIMVDMTADSSGVLYLNGDTYSDTAGSISIDSTTAGNITVTVQPDATAQLNVCKGNPFDVQMLSAAGVYTKGTGIFNVTGDVTRAVT